VKTPAFVRRLITIVGALAVAGAMVSAQPQPQATDSIELRARDLYASAEYDQALSVIGDSQEPGAQQYRALCLLALGRQADAEAALKHLITSAPEFTPSAEDMPRRFITLFAQQRREIVPGLLRKLFADAREDYRAKAYDRALPQFKRVMALSSQPEVRDAEGVDDLRLLAEGFIDIATASEAPKAEVAAAAAPAAVPAPRETVSVLRPTLPVPIKQEMPPWPSGIPVREGLTGSVRIKIDASGKVVSAVMAQPIDARYDARVLAATHFWEYKPATANGTPVEAESIVEINISPNR
jgi:tetratricopeptide (TPR) repeat protein